MIVFIKFVVSLAIVNEDPSLTIVKEDPSLTIVNEESRREEIALKGIGTYHLAVLKKISRRLSPRTFYLHVKRHSIKLHVIFFSKMTVFIKFVASLTIVNDKPSLTIDNIFINDNFFFKNDRFFNKQSYKNYSWSKLVVRF